MRSGWWYLIEVNVVIQDILFTGKQKPQLEVKKVTIFLD